MIEILLIILGVYMLIGIVLMTYLFIKYETPLRILTLFEWGGTILFTILWIIPLYFEIKSIYDSRMHRRR